MLCFFTSVVRCQLVCLLGCLISRLFDVQCTLVVLWLFSVNVSWLFGVGWSNDVSVGCALVVQCLSVVWCQSVCRSGDKDDEYNNKEGVGMRISKRTRMSTGTNWTTKNFNNKQIAINKRLGRPIRG